jgi:hypothetical protein
MTSLSLLETFLDHLFPSSSQVGGKSADGQDASLGSVKEAMNRAKALK